MQRGGQDYWLHGNHNRSTTVVTNNIGLVIEKASYNDFGAATLEDGNGQPVPPGGGVGNLYLFRSLRYDPETGFYFNEKTGRYYDPSTGRYLQRSKIICDSNNDRFLPGNAYTAMANNPWSIGSGFSSRGPSPGGRMKGDYSRGFFPGAGLMSSGSWLRDDGIFYLPIPVTTTHRWNLYLPLIPVTTTHRWNLYLSEEKGSGVFAGNSVTVPSLEDATGKDANVGGLNGGQAAISSTGKMVTVPNYPNYQAGWGYINGGGGEPGVFSGPISSTGQRVIIEVIEKLNSNYYGSPGNNVQTFPNEMWQGGGARLGGRDIQNFGGRRIELDDGWNFTADTWLESRVYNFNVWNDNKFGTMTVPSSSGGVFDWEMDPLGFGSRLRNGGPAAISSTGKMVTVPSLSSVWADATTHTD
jgi:hypothetical protein